MAADRSFTDYVKDKFFNTIYKTVENFPAGVIYGSFFCSFLARKTDLIGF